MSFEDENLQALAAPSQKTSAPNQEVEELRAQLAEAKKEAALSNFLSKIGTRFPHVPPADLKALVADRVRFENGQLQDEDVLIAHLHSKPFLRPPAPVGSTNPASATAHLAWQADQARAEYLQTYFGPGGSKKANDLAKADIAAYRALRAEAETLGLLGGVIGSKNRKK